MDIDLLRATCNRGDIKWTIHALKRIRERKILANDVVDGIVNGVVIMNYSDDKPHPSCLIYNGISSRPLHIVASTDGDKAIIITAYIPTHDEWGADFTTRKE
ncbi:MAG: DUF4258 domain-containing protein [Defluviitaleaceae bacterium]|nr:DUF4258 domain-containing protein [Defluviitaleaceae bacterium]